MPYSIRLPDGRIIANIPDEVPPQEAVKKIQAAGLVGPVPEEEEQGLLGMTGSAIMRGAKQTGSLLADVLPAQIATAVGADEYAARQMAEAAETQKEIQEKYPARYPTLESVKGVGDYIPFALETIAEQVPNIATALVPGLGGAAVAGRAALGAATARGATTAAAQAAARSAATKGAGAGAFLGSYALNSPEIFQNIYEETGELAPGAAALAGSVAAALDAILPGVLATRLSGNAKATVVEKILERSGMQPGIARGAVAGVVGGAVTEGPTEAAQEAISIAAERFVADNDAVWGSKEFNRLIESGVRGAVGGGGIAGTIGAVQGIGERVPEQAPEIQDPAMREMQARLREEPMPPVTPEVTPEPQAEVQDLGTEPERRDVAVDAGRSELGVESVVGTAPRVTERVEPPGPGPLGGVESVAREPEVREEPVDTTLETAEPTPTPEEVISEAPAVTPEITPAPVEPTAETPQAEIPGLEQAPATPTEFSLRALLPQDDEKLLSTYDDLTKPTGKRLPEVRTGLGNINAKATELVGFIQQRGFEPNNITADAPQEVKDAGTLLRNLGADAKNMAGAVRNDALAYGRAADKEAFKNQPKTGINRQVNAAQETIKSVDAFLENPSVGTGQNIVFSRQAKPGGRGMKAGSVQELIGLTRDAFANAPMVRVVQNISELPSDIQQQIADEGVIPKGLYNTKTVEIFLVADYLSGPTDVFMTLTHETVGHFGIRAILGANYSRAMGEIYNGNADIRNEVDARIEDNPKLDRDIAVEEILAERAEAEVNKAESGKKFSLSGALKQLINYLRRFARSIGVPLRDVTDIEIAELIANSRRFVEKGEVGFDRFTEGVAADQPLAAKTATELKAEGNVVATLSQFQSEAGPNRVNPQNVNATTQAAAKQRLRYDQARGMFGINTLKGLGPAAKKLMMKVMTLRMINDSAGTKVPQIARAIRIVEDMVAMRNNIMKDAQETVINDILKVLKTKNGSDQIQLMGELAVQSTMLGIDPDPQSKFHKPNQTLTDAWNMLTPDVQKIYVNMRNFYEKQVDGMYQDQINRIRENFKDNPATAGRLIKELAAEFGPDKRQGPYFPLRRFGKYWFQVGKGADKEFYMFESAFDRDFWMNERKQELAAEGRSAGDIEGLFNAGNSLSGETDSLYGALATEALFKKFDTIIDSSVVGTTPDQVKAEIKDSLRQLNYLLLPTANFKKMFIHRKNIPGASTDITRVFSSSAVNIAYQRARNKYAEPYYDNLVNAKAALEGDNTEEGLALKDVVGELEDRTTHVLGIEPTTGAQAAANNLTQFSFLWLLTAPSSAILNTIGMVAVGLPYVAARYGYGPTMGKLFDYAKKYVATAPKFREGTTVAPTLEKATNLTDVQKRAYDRFLHDNLVDASLTFDVMGLGDRPIEKRGLLTNRLVEGLTFLFHHSERMNREIMAMSIFDFAYAKNIKDKMPEDKAFEAAVQEAKDLTTMSLGDFTRAGRAPIFTGPVAKVIFQFKQYSLLMTYNLLRNTYLGFNPFRKNLTPDEKAMAKEARRRMYGVLGMTALFAGAKGMPIFGATAAMVEGLSSLGDDEDEIVDFEYWMDGYLRDTFGGTAAAAIMRGAIPQLTGASLSERAGLDLMDLWFRDSGYQKTAEDTIKEQLLSMLGPTVSIGLTAAKGWDAMQTGQFERGLESMMPAVARNIAVTKRFFEEGEATTRRGVVISEDITAGEMVSQALGFTPERIMDKQKATIKRKQLETSINAKKERVLTALYFGWLYGDEDLYGASLDKLIELQQKYPELQIDGDTIVKSIRSRYENKMLQEAFDGVDRKFGPRIDEIVRPRD